MWTIAIGILRTLLQLSQYFSSYDSQLYCITIRVQSITSKNQAYQKWKS